jgi:hypothetical protein
MGPYSCRRQSVSTAAKVGSLAILQYHTKMAIGSREDYLTDKSQESSSAKQLLELTGEPMSMILAI